LVIVCHNKQKKQLKEAGHATINTTGEIQCWLKQPMTCSHEYRYKGEMKTKKVLADDQSKPISFKNPAKKINDYFWY
jgi:hypothetical protein